MRDLNYYWRLFATGFSFCMFGFGGLIIAIFLLPAVWVLRWSPEGRKHLGKKGVQLAFRLFIELMRVMGVCNYRMNGFEALKDRKGMLVIANHPSLIDVIFLGAFIDDADCVVKQSLKRNPATFGPLTAAGYLVNSGGEEFVQKCVQSIASGNNLIIFPEGTRTVPGQALSMQRGAANIALRGDLDFTPVHISCKPTTLTKAEKWYQIPPRKFTMELTLLDDINVAELTAEAVNNTIACRQLTGFLVDYFTKENNSNDRSGQ